MGKHFNLKMKRWSSQEDITIYESIMPEHFISELQTWL